MSARGAATGGCILIATVPLAVVAIMVACSAFFLPSLSFLFGGFDTCTSMRVYCISFFVLLF